VHGYKPAWRLGGPVVSVSRLAESLVARGHRVTVFATNSNLDEDLDVPLDQPVSVDGVEVWYFRRDDSVQKSLKFVPYISRSIGFLRAPALRAALDETVPAVDLVHTHMPFIYPTWAAARAAIRHGKPLFYHQRGVFDPERLRYRGFKKRVYIQVIERGALRRAAALIALTDAEIASYRAAGATAPIRVVPNGIDVDEYLGGSRSAAESRFGLLPGETVVLFLGRLHPTKGARILLESFLRIAHDLPAARLVLAGPDESGEASAFAQRVRDAELERRVVFAGMVGGRDKIDLLTRADVLCLPSSAEGFSMAVLEALASATPVVISPGCHFPEVEQAGAGRVVAPSVELLGETLRELLPQTEQMARMGVRGRELVRRDYTWDRVTERLLDVYAEGLVGAASP
jgi:glycosyltransferase involved in cell wall biosynthesis